MSDPLTSDLYPDYASWAVPYRLNDPYVGWYKGETMEEAISVGEPFAGEVHDLREWNYLYGDTPIFRSMIVQESVRQTLLG